MRVVKVPKSKSVCQVVACFVSELRYTVNTHTHTEHGERERERDDATEHNIYLISLALEGVGLFPAVLRNEIDGSTV